MRVNGVFARGGHKALVLVVLAAFTGSLAQQPERDLPTGKSTAGVS